MSNNCPVCQSGETFVGEHRQAVPILMNRLYATHAEARSAKCGELRLMFCRDCGFAWNAAFDPELIAYDGFYENDQTYSPSFLAHVQARADAIVASVPQPTKIHLLEIGCGQGGFIGEVAFRAGARLRSAEGFDSAWRGADERGPQGSIIHRSFFTAETAGLLRTEPNVVASRHTIEHVPNPIDFLKTIRAALGAHSRARIFLETPAVDWILRSEAMQDFFYEHCSLFTPVSLRHALARSGFQVVDIQTVFGDQYLWAEALAATEVDVGAPKNEGLGNLEGARDRFVERWIALIARARSQGPVAIWGAGAKGVTFSMMVDPQGLLIDCAIDINPAKQGLFMARTGLRVLSPLDAGACSPATIIVMNPNYVSEIEAQARLVGIGARLISLDGGHGA